MTLDDIKGRWNEVLDQLIRQDRILWLAIFDARLSCFSDDVLTLDFSDSSKFPAEHNYSFIRNPERIATLTMIAQNILGIPIRITIK